MLAHKLHKSLSHILHSRLSIRIQQSNAASAVSLRSASVPPKRGNSWNFTELLNENTSWKTELHSGMRVSWTQHIGMAKLISARAKQPCWAKRISVRTLNVNSLEGHRGRRCASSIGSGFAEIRKLSEEKCQRTRTGLILVALPLAWPNSVPGEIKQIVLEWRQYHLLRYLL